MPRLTAASAVFCALLLSLAGCGEPSDQSNGVSPRLLTIASNPAGTHVYAVAAGLAKLLQDEGGMRTTIRPFSGSSVYLPLLQRGEVSLGLNVSIDSYVAYAGLPPYDTRMDKLRLLAMMFPLPIMYMVRADSDMHRVEDLRGKRVVITFRANASLEQLHTGILATGGITPSDVQSVVVAGLPEAMDMLSQGRADAVPTGLNTALALQVDSTLPGGIRYITMGANEARLAEIMPGSEPVTIMPGDVGIAVPTRVAGIVDYLNTSTDMSDELAYEIVKTIHANWDSLRADLTQMEDTPVEAMAPANIVHPYHDGAVRYYREVGLWTDAHQRNQERLLAQ